jgi:hypothetical protein
MPDTPDDLEPRIRRIISRWGHDPGALVQVLREAQEEFGGPLVNRRTGKDQLAEALDTFTGERRDGAAVDQQRGPLVAHAGARRARDADEAVLRDFARLRPEAVAHRLHQALAAGHAVGDVVRKQDAICTEWFVGQKRIEARDALGARIRDAQQPRGQGERGSRQVTEFLLDLAQHLHQCARIVPPARDDASYA